MSSNTCKSESNLTTTIDTNLLNCIKVDTNDDSNSKNKSTKFFKCFHTFTGSEYIIIGLLCFGNFCVGSAFSLLAPFFPSHAKQMGANEAWIGIIIAEYQISLFLGSIIFGKLIPPLTPKFMISLGLLVAGICSTLFGTLQWSPTGTTFVALAMTSRTIEGLGVASFFVSCWTIICLHFPNHISKLFATTEMFYGIGMIFGPAIGGLLNQFGNNYSIGFCLPFITIGSLIIFSSFLMFLLLPSKSQSQSIERTSTLGVLSKFDITLNIIITINCFLSIGFNEATLELHIESIQKLSPSLTGAIFIIMGLVYAVFSQVWAYIVEKVSNCHPICIIGCLLSMTAFIIAGPLPFFPIESQLWMPIVAQIFLGLGTGAQCVGSFTQGVRQTMKNGYPDNVSTFAVISSIYSSAIALGSAIGPEIGGSLLGAMGYRWSTVPIVGLQIVIILIIIAYDLYVYIKK